MIPQGWNIEPLSNCGIAVIDGDRGTSYPNGSDFSPEGYCLFLSAKNVTKAGLSFDECQFISKKKHHQLRKGNVEAGDLILTTRGTVGNIAYVRSLDKFDAIRINSGMVVIRNSKIAITTEYLYELFRSQIIDRQIEAMNFGSAQPQLTVKIINALKFPLPPLSEQRRIAEILSTWDKAIKVAEGLLINARLQKAALMQQLLTGIRRLSNFSNDWGSVVLADAAEILISNVDKKTDAWATDVRLCNYMDVYRNDDIHNSLPFMRASATRSQIARFGLRVGDVLITKDSEAPDDIAVPSYVAETTPDLVCGYHLAILRPGPDTDGRFLKYWFERSATRQYFASRANGATRFGLTIDAIASAPIRLPIRDEQVRISEVIFAAEREVKAHQTQLAALRQEKAALMQQLLTGRRRVRLDVEART